MRDKGSAIYQLFLLGLSIYVLTILVVESFFVTDPEVKLVLQYIDFIICLVFLLDFFVNLFTAESKLGYLKWGWIDLISAIPLVDELRWGRISRIIRILRFLRTIKSVKLLLEAIQRSKFQSFTLIVIFITFITFSLCSSLILEYEREYDSVVNTASAALWWSFLNVLNAKVAITDVKSSGGMVITIILNKVGLLLFAYFNAMVIAWMLRRNKLGTQ